MGFGVGLLMSAVGAILIWVVEFSETAVDFRLTGWVMLGFGIAGIALSLIFPESLGGPPGFARDRRETTTGDQWRVPPRGTTTS